jgi:hypothetical protein
LRRRISSTFPAHCFFTLRWQKPVPAGEEQNVGTPAVTHDRCVTCNILHCGSAKRARNSAWIEGYGIAHRHGVNGSFTVADKPSL